MERAHHVGTKLFQPHHVFVLHEKLDVRLEPVLNFGCAVERDGRRELVLEVRARHVALHRRVGHARQHGRRHALLHARISRRVLQPP